MSPRRFVVPLADIEDGPKEFTFALSEDWLRDVLEPAGASPRAAGSMTVELMKQGPEVIVRGRAEYSVTLPCVVTLDPVGFELRPDIFLLLRQGAPKPRTPHKALARPGGRGEPKTSGAGAPPDRTKRGRRPRAKAEDADAELAPGEATRDTFEGEEIVLDEFVREFLLLELPLYPRRPDLPSPEESIDSRPLAGPTGEKSIDPRLEPLAKLAARLRGEANKE